MPFQPSPSQRRGREPEGGRCVAGGRDLKGGEGVQSNSESRRRHRVPG